MSGAASLEIASTPLSKSATRFVKGTMMSKPSNNDGEGLLAILRHPINILLVCFPLGIGSEMWQWGDVPTFWINFVALIPLAKILGDATEELAAGLKNDMLAGLLNATFGNAVEMVITVQSLRAGLLTIVKCQLLGSVLSNLLLVLGMSFFCGGLSSGTTKVNADLPGGGVAARASVAKMESYKVLQQQQTQIEVKEEDDIGGANEKMQTFSAMTALVNTSMLLLSCLSFSLVTVFYSETQLDGETTMLPVSRICSIIIMLAYCAYIFFQLVTHREALAEENQDEEGEAEEAQISIGTATVLMLATTILVAVSSDFLVSSLDGVVEKAGLSQHFIGIILLPIVGNACEHASAIRFAIMDKPGLSIGIAVGSSTQMSLFVVPFAVLTGWYLDQPMDLNFGFLNVTVMLISVIVVLSVVVDGTANWLQGYLLVSAYLIVAVLYWFVPNEESQRDAWED